MLYFLRWTIRFSSLVIIAGVVVALKYAVPCRGFAAVVVGYMALWMGTMFAVVLLVVSFRIRKRLIQQVNERADLLRSVTAAVREAEKREGH